MALISERRFFFSNRKKRVFEGVGPRVEPWSRNSWKYDQESFARDTSRDFQMLVVAEK